jgi:hypothetical protein
MIDEVQPVPAPTQTVHPWRATVRTIFAAVVGLLSLLPVIAITAGVNDAALVVQVLAVTGAVTRVLALPGVNMWIERFIPWLAPAPQAPVE